MASDMSQCDDQGHCQKPDGSISSSLVQTQAAKTKIVPDMSMGADMPPYMSEAPPSMSESMGADMPPYMSEAPPSMSESIGADMPPYMSEAPPSMSVHGRGHA